MPDVVTIGETMLRLSAPPGLALEQSPHLLVHVAGAESNVAIALSRLGISSGWISRLVDNPLGRRISHEIRAHGVDVSRVVWTSGGRIGIYFVELGRAPRQSRIIYDRAGSTITTISPDDVDWAYVRQARLLHLTGITPGLSESCRALVVRALEEGRHGQVLRSFDVNFRARLWSSAEAAAVLAPLLDQLDLLICTAEDARTLFAVGGSPAEAAAALQDRFGAETVVVTGERRAAAVGRKGREEREGYPVESVDRIGAGDAFAAGFIHGFLAGNVGRGLEYGLALAALKHTFLGDIVWASEEDVQRLLAGEDIWR